MNFNTDDKNGNGGLSRNECLWIMSLITMILMIQVKIIANTAGGHEQALCASNLKKLYAAWQIYSVDNRGEFVGASAVSRAPLWTGGQWLDLPISNEASINPYAKTNGIASSPLWKYTDRNPETWRCPSDTSSGTWQGGRLTPRVRSYSMNLWLGGSAWGGSGPGWKVFKNFSDLNETKPSGILAFIDERYESINDGQLIIDMVGAFDRPRSYKIVDYPAHYHSNGGNLNFADGHVDYWRWLDPRTTPPSSPGVEYSLNISSPDNPDVARLQRVATVQESGN